MAYLTKLFGLSLTLSSPCCSLCARLLLIASLISEHANNSLLVREMMWSDGDRGLTLALSIRFFFWDKERIEQLFRPVGDFFWDNTSHRFGAKIFLGITSRSDVPEILPIHFRELSVHRFIVCFLEVTAPKRRNCEAWHNRPRRIAGKM